MTEIVMNLLALLLLFAGFVALVRFAQTDAFAGPGLGHRDNEDVSAS